MRRHLLPMVTATVLVTASLACSARGSGEGSAPSGAGSVTTTSEAVAGGASSPTEPDGPGERTAEPDAIVASLAPTEDDLEPGEQLVLRERGDEVDDQITLDYCGFEYPSESSRLARRQLTIAGDDEELAGSVEVVLYEGGAAAALDELRAAIDDCPDDEFVNPVIDGQAPLIWDHVPVPEDELVDLAEDHVAVTLTVTPEEGDPQTMTGIWQVRGDALIGTYATDVDRALALAAAGNERLEAATPAHLGL